MFDFNEWVTQFDLLCNTVRDESEKSQIKLSFSLCSQLDNLIVLNSPAILAVTYSRIIRCKLTFQESALCKIVLCIHLCRVNHYNSTAIRLISSSLALIFALQRLHTNQKKKAQTKLYQQLKFMRYDLACSILQLSRLLSTSSPDMLRHAQRAKLRRWQWFPVIVTFLVDCQHVSWEKKLSHLFHALPPWCREWCYGLFDYPSFIAPGTVVMHSDKAKTVVDVTKRTYVISDFETLDSVPHDACTITNQVVENIHEFEKMAKKLKPRRFFTASYKVDHPPAALLNIIEQTHSLDFNIDSLISDIESEPNFSSFIRHSAGETNRLNLTVTSLKQAVMTYGSQRLADMLTTHALFERLTQKDFPLRQAFTEHVSLCSTLASVMAKHTGVMLPQTASLIVILCYSALFTEPALKLSTHWSLIQSDVHSPLSRILNSTDIKKAKLSSISLAKAWRISSVNLTLLNRLFETGNATLSKTQALICLASFWALEAKEGTLKFQISDAPFERKTCTLLSISNSDKQDFLENTQSLMSCSLHD